jgi:hypothetical protein
LEDNVLKNYFNERSSTGNAATRNGEITDSCTEMTNQNHYKKEVKHSSLISF